jgi:hypothetical protein
MNQQAGFAIIPLIIAIAAIIVIGGGSAAVYSVQKNNEVEKSALRQELQLLQERQVGPTQEPVEEEQLDPSPSPTPSSSPAATPKPAVKAAITVAPAASIPTPSQDSAEPNVPLIVQQEFYAVYGRNPSNDESDFWKTRMRKNGYSREAIRLAMQSEKRKEEEQEAQHQKEVVAVEQRTQEQATQNLFLKDSQCKVVAQQWSDTYTATTAPYFRSNPGFVVAEAAKLYQLQYNDCMTSGE